MMYNDKLVCAVKVNGKVLRENKDAVYLPFGSEYSLSIKNLNSVRALVKVWIDGTDVTDGTSGLIVPANSTVDLERFIKNGNLSGGNKFKFIERTQKISDHRGNKIDDGLIRLEFQYERQNAPIVNNWPGYTVTTTNWPHPVQYYPKVTYAVSDSNQVTNSVLRGLSGSLQSSAAYSSNAASVSQNSVQATAFINQASHEVSKTLSTPESETGITVAGGVSNQSFTSGYFGASDGVKHTMVMRLLGEVQGQVVQAPVTVKTKLVCSSCGTVNKHGTKFCRECGTGLQVV